MTAAAPATYRCSVCGLPWTYEAVRHLACCRDCGSGLVRTPTTPERAGADNRGTGEATASGRGAAADLALAARALPRHPAGAR